jgi:hypothetical protein
MVNSVPTMLVDAPAAAAATHRRAAFHAKLRLLGQHAGFHFALVGNEFAAQPHGVGRASLADIDWGGLGPGPADATTKDNAGR